MTTSSTSSSAQCPTPIFDNLDYLKLTPITSNDIKYSIEFLGAYAGSTATFNAYRREVERLLHWCIEIAHKSVREITRVDFEAFLKFCQNPPKSWIGLKNVTRFIDKDGARIPNPEWRPFVVSISKKSFHDGQRPTVDDYLLSQSALQAIFAITSSFYQYLIQENYAEINPVSQIRQKSQFLRKTQGKKVIRKLSELQWNYVINTAENMDERTLFIMNALYSMYLRISELSSSPRWEPQMQHFYKDGDANWWFKTVGKGNKERDIAVSDAMLNALKRYRLSLNLSPLPSPGESTLLLSKNKGKGSITGTRHIRKLVQACFDKAATRLAEHNFHEEADQLRCATVHWLRHTGISEDVKIRPREHVRDDAGHGSGAITDRYIDVELRERHASAKNKLIKVPS
ncbi:MAG TPA: site-specific integrase [Gammaproteobacteria bacterium]|nr:site-specific integrase [Gammaproteobacteria bacterium]